MAKRAFGYFKAAVKDHDISDGARSAMCGRKVLYSMRGPPATFEGIVGRTPSRPGPCLWY